MKAILIGSTIAIVAVIWPHSHGPSCFEDEAAITYQDTATCYPVDNLPADLYATIKPAHW